MNRPHILLALAALAAMSGAPARADIAPPPEFGQSLAPRHPTEIAMRSETVTMRLDRGEASVVAVFDLENTGARTDLEVGFPDVVLPAEWSTDGPPKGVSEVKLKDFTASVDGKAVETGHRYVREAEMPDSLARATRKLEALRARRAGEPEGERQKAIDRSIAELERSLDRWRYDGWIVWPMSFAAGAHRTVEVRYRVPYQMPYRGTLLGAKSFGYVLRTGAWWKGSIGRARLVVEFGEGMGRQNLVKVEPEGSTGTENGLEWDLRDLEPDRDVHIQLLTWADYPQAADAYLAMAKAAKTPEAEGESLAGAALCYEQAKRWEDCLRLCRRLARAEKALSKKHGCCYRLTPFFRSPYLPWEVRETRCLRKLGRWEEAHTAARAAVAAIRDAAAEIRSPPYLDSAAVKRFLERWEPELARSR